VGSLEVVVVGRLFMLRDDSSLDWQHFLVDSGQQSSCKCKEVNDRLNLMLKDHSLESIMRRLRASFQSGDGLCCTVSWMLKTRLTCARKIMIQGI
jgi:hypothetical protein